MQSSLSVYISISCELQKLQSALFVILIFGLLPTRRSYKELEQSEDYDNHENERDQIFGKYHGENWFRKIGAEWTCK